jgi:hypothetical protein
MTEIRKLREQIDACRPGSDDLALPALADLAAAAGRDAAVAAELARSQRFDQAVSVALHELPVPAGLMERLLAATEANKPSPQSGPEPEAGRSRWTRRRLLVWAGSLASVLLLAATTFLVVSRPSREVTQEELGLAVAQWANVNVAPNSWKTASSLPAKFSIPDAISVKRPSKWRSLAVTGRGWAGHGVAMDLTATNPRAMLFVVSSPAKFQVTSKPAPITVSGFPGRVSARAWQNPTTRLLYVLVVVEAGTQRLDDFLERRPQA